MSGFGFRASGSGSGFGFRVSGFNFVGLVLHVPGSDSGFGLGSWVLRCTSSSVAFHPRKNIDHFGVALLILGATKLSARMLYCDCYDPPCLFICGLVPGFGVTGIPH